ncbi:MAG: hypothetical protein LBR77_00810 [Lachnospiraceae bacterium]|nr:hypothetical protein [Lachnospiraceae bacterium]
MMKKTAARTFPLILTIVLALAIVTTMALSLAACGGSGNSDQTTSDSSGKSTKKSSKDSDTEDTRAGDAGEDEPFLKYRNEIEAYSDPDGYPDAERCSVYTYEAARDHGYIPDYDSRTQYAMELYDLCALAEGEEECYLYRLVIDEPKVTYVGAYAYAYQSGNIYMEDEYGDFILILVRAGDGNWQEPSDPPMEEGLGWEGGDFGWDGVYATGEQALIIEGYDGETFRFRLYDLVYDPDIPWTDSDATIDTQNPDTASGGGIELERLEGGTVVSALGAESIFERYTRVEAYRPVFDDLKNQIETDDYTWPFAEEFPSLCTLDLDTYRYLLWDEDDDGLCELFVYANFQIYAEGATGPIFDTIAVFTISDGSPEMLDDSTLTYLPDESIQPFPIPAEGHEGLPWAGEDAWAYGGYGYGVSEDDGGYDGSDSEDDGTIDSYGDSTSDLRLTFDDSDLSGNVLYTVLSGLTGVPYGQDEILYWIGQWHTGTTISDMVIWEDEDLSSRFTYPVWRLEYLTGENEDTDVNFGVYIQTDTGDHFFHAAMDIDTYYGFTDDSYDYAAEIERCIQTLAFTEE